MERFGFLETGTSLHCATSFAAGLELQFKTVVAHCCSDFCTTSGAAWPVLCSRPLCGLFLLERALCTGIGEAFPGFFGTSFGVF